METKKEGLSIAHKTKIVVAIMVQNEEDYIELCLRSVMGWADKIVIVNGGSTDMTNAKIAHLCDDRFVMINSPYDLEDPIMDGKQRNVYLDYIKEHCDGWWCLVIDADENVCDNGWKLKHVCYEMEQKGFTISSPLMVHFINNLKMVDATKDKHYCPMRLFKVRKEISYPNHKHTILNYPEDTKGFNCETITIFHMGYLRGLFKVMKRYRHNLQHSPIHTEDYLVSWKDSHLFGRYPVKEYAGDYSTLIKKFFQF